MKRMVHLCLVILAHQPLRLNTSFPYERVKRMAEGASLIDRYFDEDLNRAAFTALSKKCFVPTLRTLLELVTSTANSEHPFKFSMAMSGLFIEQGMKHSPDLIELMKRLAMSKQVEILGRDYLDSLSSIYPGDKNEFIEQVTLHRDLMKKLFGADPKIFVNTGLIYNNSIAKTVADLGFDAILMEGVEGLIEGKPPTYLYSSSGERSIRLILRHRKLMDEIGLTSGGYEETLTVEKVVDIISFCSGEVVVIAPQMGALMMWGEEEGLSRFIAELVRNVANRRSIEWSTPSEVIKSVPPAGVLSVPDARTISWMGEGEDVGAWLDNPMQRISFDRLAALRPYIREINDDGVRKVWRLLQQSDHLLHMSNSMVMEDLHPSYYSSSAEVFAVFDSIYSDFEGKVGTIVQRARKAKPQPAPTPPLSGPLSGTTLSAMKQRVRPGAY